MPPRRNPDAAPSVQPPAAKSETPKAFPTVTLPIEPGEPGADHPAIIGLPKLEAERVKALAVHLCLDEHSKPFSYSMGQPKWASYIRQARSLLIALAFVEAEKGRDDD